MLTHRAKYICFVGNIASESPESIRAMDFLIPTADGSSRMRPKARLWDRQAKSNKPSPSPAESLGSTPQHPLMTGRPLCDQSDTSLDLGFARRMVFWLQRCIRIVTSWQLAAGSLAVRGHLPSSYRIS